MMKMRKIAGLMLIISSGCLPLREGETGGLDLVPSNPFSQEMPAQGLTKMNYAPADSELSERVDFLGRKILAANPQIGFRPLFATIGAPHAEIFHCFYPGETSMVWITSGLVQNCRNEKELAAILSHELAKMVSERESRTPPQTRNPTRTPPQEVQVGPVGQGGSYLFTGDQTYQAELGKFEKTHPKNQKKLPRPDPETLARIYLVNAGYQKTDLDSVAPLIENAERNYQIEKQFRNLGTRWQSPTWNSNPGMESADLKKKI